MTTPTLKLNSPLPFFSHLPATNGKTYSSTDFTDEILVIVFSCNHCPYVQAYEERIIAFQNDYASKGVQLVAINSNDEINYPDDNFENMVKRAKLKGFNFIYLRDGNQTVAESFGATHTPQFFVFSAKGGSASGGDNNRKLCYSGKFDDNWKDTQLVKENYLRDAVDALLAGNEVKVKKTYSIGCTIKWR
ncbi:MAG: thioredoxin family protein [Ignavibacteriales bacterium]|nr:thioredoxin family protein [Ignavibacteriales bacterium]